jgi:hypothetical protein
MIDQAAKDVLFFFGGFVLIIVFMFSSLAWIAKPSPMQLCIKAGYEWIDEDCVKGDGNAGE